MTRRFTPLTLSQAVEARRRYLRGFSMAEIADRLGSSEHRIRHALMKMGTPIRPGNRLALSGLGQFQSVPEHAIERAKAAAAAVKGQRIHRAVADVARAEDVPRQILMLLSCGPGVMNRSRASREHLSKIERDTRKMRRETRAALKRADRARELRLASEPWVPLGQSGPALGSAA